MLEINNTLISETILTFVRMKLKFVRNRPTDRVPGDVGAVVLVAGAADHCWSHAAAVLRVVEQCVNTRSTDAMSTRRLTRLTQRPGTTHATVPGTIADPEAWNNRGE